MVTDAKMQMVFGTTSEMPNSKPLSEEETATQTPRSTFKSSADLSVETPRSAEDEASDSESAGGDDEFEHQYYAFLREMAGSVHEATGEDDESDWDSEDEAGEEDEGGPDKTSGGLSGPTTDTPESGPPALCPPAGGPPGAGGLSHNGEAKGDDVGQDEGQDPRAGSGGDVEPQETGKWAALGDVGKLRLGDADLSGSTNSGKRGSSTRSGGGSEDSSGDTPGESDVAKPPEAARCWVPSPSHDNRGPVEDDYDVVQAVADFASKQSGDPLLFERECLQLDIRSKEAQVRSLWGPANNPQIAEKTRAHYAKVRLEILGEVESLHRQLSALDAGLAGGEGRSAAHEAGAAAVAA